MRVVKKSVAVLLAMVIAASAVIIGYAENSAKEGNEEKTEIRMVEAYGTTELIVFSDVYIGAFETINICQRDENNEKTLITSLSAKDNCYIFGDEPKEIFVVRITGTNIFVPQGSYTLELTAKEIPPEGFEKENDLSIDFEYDDIINPKIEKTTFDYTIEVGKKTELSEIFTLPEEYRSVYYISENRESPFVSYVEIDGNTITGTSRGNTVLIIKDRLTDKIIAKINLKVIPEKPDNFFELLGSTFSIIGSDTLKTFLSIGEAAGVGILGLFYSLLFPVATVFSLFGSFFGLIL